MKTKKINKTPIYLILIIGLISFAFAQQPTLLSLQGKLIDSTTGAKIISADLRVNINGSSGIVFNQNYSNAVSNGIFDLVLGSTYSLNLSFNEQYNLTVFVNNVTRVGGPFPFRGGQGQVGAGDIATTESFVFGNVNISDSLNVSNTVQATTFIGDGSSLSGISSDFTNYSDINVTNFVANNTLFVNGSRVGIGTSSPKEELTVVGSANVTENLSVTGILKMGTFFARPGCIAGEAGGLIFDTNNSKPYVCNGSEWKPLDSDYDSDGITDWNDQDDSNASAIHPNLTSANIIHNVTIFGVTGNRSAQVFTSNGTWNNTHGYNTVLVILAAGGGGGSGGRTSTIGGGGGSGGEVKIEGVDVTDVSSVNVTIGTGGGGGAYATAGSDGSASSFGALITTVGGNNGVITTYAYPAGTGSGMGWTAALNGKPGFSGLGGICPGGLDGSGGGGGGSYGAGGDGGADGGGTGSTGTYGGAGGGGGDGSGTGGAGGSGICIVIPIDYYFNLTTI